MPSQHEIKCPTCHKVGDWFAGKYGPFCSHRCKLVDLGKWFGGEHCIAEPLRPEHFNEDNPLLPGEQPGTPTDERDAGGG